MNDQILRAIRTKTSLTFSYSDKPRRVQPHAYGLSRKGEDLLRAYDPIEATWKLFTVAKITDLAPTAEGFYTAPGYVANDSAMSAIYEGVA